jgi:GNAT superfamily N-acetyltransferase
VSGPGNQPRYYVRGAAQADLEAVLAMKAAAWREAYGRLRDESFFAAAEATLPQQVEHWRCELERGAELWLAEDAHGRCVGLASAGPPRDPEGQVVAGAPSTGLPPLELRALYVLAEAQGTGVADALLTRAIGDAPCRLWVLAVNERARSFYRRHGFVDVDAPQPMTGPWSGMDAQLMVRRGA